MRTTPYTPSEIKTKVSSDPAWAARAIVCLYNYQTSAEQQFEHTHELNRVGFSAFDAEILTSFAKQINKGYTLSSAQLAIAYKKLPKYSGQLARIANQAQ